MERRGVYRKGSAGHVRNVGAYRMARQNFKKWRAPVAAFLGLLLVFGMAPVVGENFQTSLLTSPEVATVLQNHPEEARKALLGSLAEFLRDCERFQLDACVSRGKSLTASLVGASPEELGRVLTELEDFESAFEEMIATMACKYDLRKLVFQGRSSAREIQEFFDRYGETLGGIGDTASLMQNLELLDGIVESCSGR